VDLGLWGKKVMIHPKTNETVRPKKKKKSVGKTQGPRKRSIRGTPGGEGTNETKK